MRDFIIANISVVVTFITILVTWALGKIAKKSKYVNNHIIPLQNIVIGVVVSIIYYLATGDVNVLVSSSSAIATIIYDAVHGFEKLIGGK